MSGVHPTWHRTSGHVTSCSCSTKSPKIQSSPAASCCVAMAFSGGGLVQLQALLWPHGDGGGHPPASLPAGGLVPGTTQSVHVVQWEEDIARSSSPPPAPSISWCLPPVTRWPCLLRVRDFLPCVAWSTSGWDSIAVISGKMPWWSLHTENKQCMNCKSSKYGHIQYWSLRLKKTLETIPQTKSHHLFSPSGPTWLTIIWSPVLYDLRLRHKEMHP